MGSRGPQAKPKTSERYFNRPMFKGLDCSQYIEVIDTIIIKYGYGRIDTPNKSDLIKRHIEIRTSPIKLKLYLGYLLFNKKVYGTTLKTSIARYGRVIGLGKHSEFVVKNRESQAKATQSRYDENGVFLSTRNVEFYMKKGFTEEESKEIIKQSVEKSEKTKIKNGTNGFKNRLNTTQLQYWLNKGLSLEDAKAALKDRQATFTLEKCIQRYGEMCGREVYEERQRKWVDKVYNSLTDEEKIEFNARKFPEDRQHGLIRYSSSSMTAFTSIISLCNDYGIECLYGKTEYRIKLKPNSLNRNIFFYDLTIPKLKIVCEFQGHLFHAHPTRSSLDWKHLYQDYSRQYSIDVADFKRSVIEGEGYKYFEVWDDMPIEPQVKDIMDYVRLKINEKGFIKGQRHTAFDGFWIEDVCENSV